MSGSGADFLYPFMAEGGADPGAVLADVEASALQKCADVVALRRAFIEAEEDALLGAAAAMAQRFRNGGRLLTFGCGGSATDALDLAHDFARPPVKAGGEPRYRPLPALALVSDPAVLTAISNDVGFENVFVRQVISYGRPGDIAVGLSTSGNSRALLDGFAHARRVGMLTVGILGYDGGEAARGGALHHTLIIRGDYIPRVQEAQATICHALRDLVEAMLE